ncbi:Lrp/AsnC family transcriptional regulator [Phaeobacter sp. C3_T13_0]|uniref:Lrp/AsnC family transcriptional regulator n=1 Tax=Phaeobacter cretensis TaxID=3342641 RepID=UPI0039BCE3D1
MDTLNIRIIEALQKRGDMTNAELAEIVNSTPSTCLRRVRDLQKSGFLAKNIFLADAAKLGRGLKAIIATTTRDHTRADREAFARRVEAEPSIAYAYGVTGEVDAILIGNFQNMVEYQDVCDRLFDDDDNIVRYTTHFISEIYKTEPAIPCDVLRQTSAEGEY